MSRVAVVGAGLAGLVAARRLRERGADVAVFDKGRRPGGRLNTRDHGPYRFDHGAQFFTVRDARVRPMLDEWLARRVVRRWDGRLVRISGNSVEPAHEKARYVGAPEMISLATELAAGLDVSTQVRIAAIERQGSVWRLQDDEGAERGLYDRVVVAVPAAQAAPLLRESPELSTVARGVEMEPCWTGMFVFEEPPPMTFDGAFVANGDLSWVAWNSSKPGRTDAQSWVVHASPDWTRRHWDLDPADVSRLLRNALEARFGPVPRVLFERAHRWRYARARGTAPGVMYDPSRGIGVAGDWCTDGRVEGALTAGIEIVDRMFGS